MNAYIYSNWISHVVRWLHENLNLNFVDILSLSDPRSWEQAVIICDPPGAERWRLCIYNYRKIGDELECLGDISISNPDGWEEDKKPVYFLNHLRSAILAHHPEWIKDSTSSDLTRSEASHKEDR